jgi:hypothetical protein
VSHPETGLQGSGSAGRHERSSQGPTGIACSRLHIDLPERGFQGDFSIGDRVHRAPAGQSDGIHAIDAMQTAQQGKECLLVDGLYRTGNIAMALLERVVGGPGGSQQKLQIRGIRNSGRWIRTKAIFPNRLAFGSL